MSNIYLPLRVKDESDVSDTMKLDEIYIEARFGHAPFYFLFNTDEETGKVVKNTNHHFGGKDNPLQVAQKTDADTIFASHLGSKPYSLFKSANYKIIKVDGSKPLSDLIKMYTSGQLEELPEPEAGTTCSGGKNHHH